MLTAKLHPLKINKVSWSRGGKGAISGDSGGRQLLQAAGGGSWIRLIRKYKPTSTVALVTPAARHMKIKGKKINHFSFSDFYIPIFKKMTKKQDFMSDCMLLLM